MQNVLSQEEQERKEFKQECLNKARAADLSHAYFARMADNPVSRDIRFDSAEELIQAAKEGTIITPFARSNPRLLNELRAFDIPLDTKWLVMTSPHDLKKWTENQLISRFAEVFFKAKYTD